MAHHPIAAQLPAATGLLARKGIELLTWGTPNGFKASILLEELKDAHGMEYTTQPISLMKVVQKSPWYLELNCNCKIPTIVDHDADGLSIGESCAIIQYLGRYYDPGHKFTFASRAEAAKCDQWLAFMQGDLSPTAVQCVRYYRFLPQKHNFPLQAFHREALRIFGVMDTALKGRDYLVGEGKGRYSIADIANFAFVNNSFFIGVGLLDQWPNLKAWWQRIWSRDAVKRGCDIPFPAMTVNAMMEEKMQSDAEFRQKEEGLRQALQKALDEYPPMPGGPPNPSGKLK